MTLSELINNRQSNRKYKEQAVERELVVKCIEAARLAPSACNAQAWKFVVVDQTDLCKQLAEASTGLGMNRFVAQAPVIITVVIERANITSSIGSLIKNKDYSQIDIGIAVEHICLQAVELGLGSCILGWFDEPKVKKLLKIPSSKRVPLLITLGYPNDNQRTSTRVTCCQSRATFAVTRSLTGAPKFTIFLNVAPDAS